MHKLIRDPVSPACLVGKTDPPNRWNEIYNNNDARDSIWAKLETMQGNRCAYCENLFTGKSRHIEHFKPRTRFPEATFDWPNLFGSCPHQYSCGNFKDNGRLTYHPDELIKPDVDEPSDYLFFASDGSVTPKAGLNQTQLLKANSTIETFNLNGFLKQLRKTQLASYETQARFYFEDLPRQVTSEQWHDLYKAKLLELDALPFSSAVKQLFQL